MFLLCDLFHFLSIYLFSFPFFNHDIGVQLKHLRLVLQIKGRVLGYGHTDYADTMYHLGTVVS